MPDALLERNLKLTVEYDGSAYAGWQFQANLPTVQLRLMQAVERMTGSKPIFSVAGRTDAGVHAEGQVVSFHTRSGIEAQRFVPGLNSLLPRDISVHSVEEVAPGFDARHDSVSKRYRYQVYVGRGRAALLEQRAWHIRHAFDLPALRAAAALLVGEHDFNAFRSTACDAPHARRNMLSIDIDQCPRPPAGEIVAITFHANAFCRHMCRIIAGTLVEVAIDKRRVQDVADALLSRDRTRAGMTAPPRGLTLLTVHYP
jgi:tRNA pseudouridine38-40 synthase